MCNPFASTHGRKMIQDFNIAVDIAGSVLMGILAALNLDEDLLAIELPDHQPAKKIKSKCISQRTICGVHQQSKRMTRSKDF